MLNESLKKKAYWYFTDDRELHNLGNKEQGAAFNVGMWNLHLQKLFTISFTLLYSEGDMKDGFY